MALVGILTIFVAFKLCDLNFVKEQVSFKLFLILGSALAISKALMVSGASDVIGDTVISGMNGQSTFTIIVGLYLLTLMLSLFVTNAAAVAIVFPIGAAVINAMGISADAVLVGIAFGASCSFLTPYGYQTNLMVNGPGNYKLVDFIRLGLPLTFIYSAITLWWIQFYYLT
jgi:di/tricarboxylate transporter